jgi:subtilisin-like proprotein convertase family protein/subtilisin family serine protease
VECLEDRRLLAAKWLDLVSPAADVATQNAETAFYLRDGRPIELSVREDRMAVRWDNRETGFLPEPVKPLRRASGDLVVYEVSEPVAIGPNLQDFVRHSAGFVEEVPVFHMADTDSEAVLLDEVIVAFDADVGEVEVATAALGDESAVVDVRRLTGTPNQYVVQVSAENAFDVLTLANRWNALDGVQWATPNFYQSWRSYSIPNDERFANQWHANNTGQGGGVVDADVDLPEAWSVNPGGSSNIVVGVIDDGVASDHPDLLNFAVPGEIPGDGIDNDGNGWVDDVYGWNFVNDNNDSGYSAVDAHGTAVAGVAAGRGDNGMGIAGAAYRSPVLSARIFDNDEIASDAQIAAAIYYMAGRTADGTGTWRSADVVNNSWGGAAPSPAISEALQWAATQGRMGNGATFFFATGNEYSSVSLPASLSATIPGVVAVGATNNFGERSDYSNTGPEVDLVAPSDDSRSGYLAIETTDIPGTLGYSSGDYTGSGANGFGGTSAATPLASGIAALALAELEAQNLSLTPAQMRSWMRNNTDLIGGAYDVESGHSNDFGYGRINAGALLRSIGKAEISVVTATDDLVSGAGTIDLGEAVLGQAVVQTVRVRNQGTSTLELSGLSVSGGAFEIASGLVDSSLGIGEATTFQVRFTPAAAGTTTATMGIESNDADEEAFQITLTGTGVIASVSGSVFEDFDGDGLRDPGESPIADQRVYLDLDENGALTRSAFNFSSDEVVAISDFETSRSTVEVSGIGEASAVEVTVNLSHTYTADLDIVLVSPDGIRFVLASGVGGSGADFVETVFADDAAEQIETGFAPFTGRFRPADSLVSAAAGTIDGTWTLEVSDTLELDSGAIESWTLSLIDGEPVARSDGAGFYSFTGLPADSYRVAAVSDPGWQGTGPDHFDVVLDSLDDSQTDLDFGFGFRNRIYGRVFDDINADGIQDAVDVGLVDEVVFLDVNESGALDGSFPRGFVESTVEPIADQSFTRVSQVVSGISDGSASDLDVRIDLSHSYVSDLVATLISPDGVRAKLFEFNGGDGQAFANTVFDEDASISIVDGQAPFSGSFRPLESLDTLLGGTIAGTWTLEIQDVAPEDVGTLNEWELLFVAAEPSVQTDANGHFQLDVSPGENRVRLIRPDGRELTQPSSGEISVTADGLAIFSSGFGTSPTDAVPELEQVIVNSNQASRSLLTEVVVVFDREVTVQGDAIEIVHRESGQPVGQWLAEYSLVNGKSVGTIHFEPGAFVDARTDGKHSLADGSYQLNVTAAGVTSVASGRSMNADVAFGTEAVDSFFRLFGDLDGDRDVDAADYARLGATLLRSSGEVGFQPELDFDGDGDVDGLDLAHFRRRLVRRLSG